MAVEKQAFRYEVSFNRNWGFSMPGSRWQKTNPRDYDSEMRQVPLDPTGTTAWTHPASLLDHVLSAMKVTKLIKLHIPICIFLVYSSSMKVQSVSTLSLGLKL